MAQSPWRAEAPPVPVAGTDWRFQTLIGRMDDRRLAVLSSSSGEPGGRESAVLSMTCGARPSMEIILPDALRHRSNFTSATRLRYDQAEPTSVDLRVFSDGRILAATWDTDRDQSSLRSMFGRLSQAGVLLVEVDTALYGVRVYEFRTRNLSDAMQQHMPSCLSMLTAPPTPAAPPAASRPAPPHPAAAPARPAPSAPEPAPSPGSPLTQGEIRALAEGISECWSVDGGMLSLDQVVVEVRIQIDAQGNVRNVVPGARGLPTDPRARAVYEATRRALLAPQCNPLRIAPGRAQTVMGATFRFNPRGLVR